MTITEAKKVAIIGSGVAGLCAARHCSAPDSGVECTVFEQASSIGGTWVYTDQTEIDSYGLPVHSSMYKSLRTNLPREAMSYPDFPHPNAGKTLECSYLPSKSVLNYLYDYAEHFNLTKCMKFNQHVKQIHPIENERWQLTVIDLPTNVERKEHFDAVMICNGHNSKPRYPDIPGMDKFQGRKTHSHHYREPTPFTGQSVLLIGAGPSGLDLTCEIAKVSTKVYLSHHSKHAGNLKFADNVVLKPDVESLSENSVKFKDGSECEIETIVYCTGYLINYPFFSKECNIEVEDNFVKPLYRHMISIENPTLCIIGIPKHLPIFHLCHIQSQFFLKTITGEVKLPSKQQMHDELNTFIKEKLEKGVRMRDMVALGKDMDKYYNELANRAGVQCMSTLIVKMYFDAYDRIFKDFMTFRNNCYRIIDNETFNVIDMREIKPQNKCKNPSCSRCSP